MPWGKSPWHLLKRRVGDPEIWSWCSEEKKNFFPLHGRELQLIFETNVSMHQHCSLNFCHNQDGCMFVSSERWKSNARQLLVILVERSLYYWPLSAVDSCYVLNRWSPVTVCKFLQTYYKIMNWVSNFGDMFKQQGLAGGLGLLCNSWVIKCRCYAWNHNITTKWVRKSCVDYIK
jgi:hypothetical protein